MTSGTPIETAEYLRASSEEFHRGPGRRRSLGSDAASRSSYDDAELVVPRRFRDHDVGNRAVHCELVELIITLKEGTNVKASSAEPNLRQTLNASFAWPEASVLQAASND